MVAENINMQMEAEHADLFDRNMMALYGAKPGKASRLDMAPKSEIIPASGVTSQLRSKSPGIL